MPLIDGFVHRGELAELLSRWTVGRPLGGDVLRLKQIVNFNFYAARLWVDDLARRLLRGLHGTEPCWTRIRTKGALKDFAVAHPTYTDERIEALSAHYRRFPEDYYRETPIDGGFYTVGEGEARWLAGMTRIKRSRRIAEKGARRLVDSLFERIRDGADDLAEERAARLGISVEQLVTSREEMVAEFQHAERRVIKRVKQGTLLDELDVLPIPDVVGIKLIVEPPRYPALLHLLGEDGACRLVEEEHHRGPYNATNLRVALRFPRGLLAAHPPAGLAAEVLRERGLGGDLEADYRSFLDGAEDEVGVEIIVSTFGEFVESEIGRSMHEERVLSQRANTEYTGHLASNVRYLMDYLFALSRCPGVPAIDDVPIELWVKYMPETIEQLRWELFMPHARTLDAVDLDGVAGAAD